MVRAERRVLFETVLSLERGRGQGITVYKIDLVFFIHFKPHSGALCATGRREVRECGFSSAITAICGAPAQTAV